MVAIEPFANIDDFVKIVNPTQAGIQRVRKYFKILDFRFHGNDRKVDFLDFLRGRHITCHMINSPWLMSFNYSFKGGLSFEF